MALSSDGIISGMPKPNCDTVPQTMYCVTWALRVAAARSAGADAAASAPQNCAWPIGLISLTSDVRFSGNVTIASKEVIMSLVRQSFEKA